MRRLGAVVLTIAALLTVPATPGQASGSSAVCSFEFHVSFTPGLTLTWTNTHFSTGGQTGSILCLGTANGQELMGSGAIGVDGVGPANCAADTPTLRLSLTLPTAGGAPTSVTGQMKATRIGLVITFAGDVFSATALGVPDPGACLALDPIRGGTVTGQGNLHT